MSASFFILPEDNTVSEVFIDELRSVQKAINQKSFMNKVEIKYRNKQYKSLLKIYNDCIKERKNFFVSVYMVFYFVNFRRFPKFYSSFFSKHEIEEQKIKTPQLDELLAIYTECNDRNLIDLMTFVTFPSFFNFFSTTFGNDKFIKTLMKINNRDVFFNFARMAFFSPMFLNFISKVFTPWISPLLSETQPKFNENVFIENVKIRLKRFAKLVPSYVVDILCIKNKFKPSDILYNSFFKYIIDFPSNVFSFPQFVGIVDFYQVLNNETLEFFKNIFVNKKNDGTILTEMVDIILGQDKNKFSKSFLTKKDKENVPSLFNAYMFSSLDIALFNGSYIEPTEYRIIMCDRKNSLLHGNIHNYYMKESYLTTESLLCGLLEYSDNIPHFDELPEINIKEFILTYLVNRGDIDLYPKRLEFAKMIEMKCGFDNESNLIHSLKRIDIDSKNIIRSLSSLTKIEKSLLSLNKKITNTLISMNNFTIWINLMAMFSDKLPNKHKLVLYLKSPAMFINDFKAFNTIVKESNCFNFIDNKKLLNLTYSLMSRDFDFFIYSNSLKQLKIYDDSIFEKLSTLLSVFLDQSFPIPKEYNPNHKPKSLILREVCQKLRFCSDIMEMLIIGFHEILPLRKLSMISEALNKTNAFFIKNIPPTMELGADEKTPIYVLLFLYANPPRIASNYVFLNDYCYSSDFGGIFDNCILSILSTCKLVFNLIYPNLSLDDYCRK